MIKLAKSEVDSVVFTHDALQDMTSFLKALNVILEKDLTQVPNDNDVLALYNASEKVPNEARVLTKYTKVALFLLVAIAIAAVLVACWPLVVAGAIAVAMGAPQLSSLFSAGGNNVNEHNTFKHALRTLLPTSTSNTLEAPVEARNTSKQGPGGS